MTDIFKRAKEKHGDGMHLYQEICPDMKRIGGCYEAKNPMRNDKNAGSFRIFDDGGWKDWANGQSGDYIDLISIVKGYNDTKQAAEFLLGQESIQASIITKKNKYNKPVPKLEIVPASAKAPWKQGRKDPSKDQIEPWEIFEYTTPLAYWKYKDVDGNFIGMCARYEEKNADGKSVKTYRPIRWVNGKWKSVKWPMPFPLFGAENLSVNPQKPIMVVSGEKTCVAAQEKFPNHVCISWPFGDHNVQKADWDLIRGRDLIIIPDNDNSGYDSAKSLQSIIGGRIVQIPSKYPSGWDIADAEQYEDLSWIFEIKKELEKKPQQVRVIDYFSPLQITKGKDQKPVNCIENLEEIIDRIGIKFRFNVIKKYNEITDINGKTTRLTDANAAFLKSECGKFNFPMGQIDCFISNICDRNQYNPVTDWVESKPWDGVSRFRDLLQTIGSSTKQVEVYLKKWMISGIAAAFSFDGVSAQGVLILQGPQYIGKTSWFKSLFPKNLFMEGALLRPDDRDSVKQFVSNWCVEIGEIDATFRKGDPSQLKAFITKSSDTFRAAYAKNEDEYVRRTFCCGTVNPNEFLVDETGNRRFWVISCDSLDTNHGIDIQQLWAEALTWYMDGESHYLSYEEVESLNESNSDHESSDNVDDLIATRFNWASDSADWEYRTIADILYDIGIERPFKSDRIRAKKVIRKLSGKHFKERRTGMARLVLFAPRKY